MIVFLSPFHLPHRCTPLFCQPATYGQREKPCHSPHQPTLFSSCYRSFSVCFFSFILLSFLSFVRWRPIHCLCKLQEIYNKSKFAQHILANRKSNYTRIKQCRSARTLYFTLNWLHIKILPYFSF